MSRELYLQLVIQMKFELNSLENEVVFFSICNYCTNSELSPTFPIIQAHITIHPSNSIPTVVAALPLFCSNITDGGSWGDNKGMLCGHHLVEAALWMSRALRNELFHRGSILWDQKSQATTVLSSPSVHFRIHLETFELFWNPHTSFHVLK